MFMCTFYVKYMMTIKYIVMKGKKKSFMWDLECIQDVFKVCVCVCVCVYIQVKLYDDLKIFI